MAQEEPMLEGPRDLIARETMTEKRFKVIIPSRGEFATIVSSLNLANANAFFAMGQLEMVKLVLASTVILCSSELALVWEIITRCFNLSYMLLFTVLRCV